MSNDLLPAPGNRIYFLFSIAAHVATRKDIHCVSVRDEASSRRNLLTSLRANPDWHSSTKHPARPYPRRGPIIGTFLLDAGDTNWDHPAIRQIQSLRDHVFWM